MNFDPMSYSRAITHQVGSKYKLLASNMVPSLGCGSSMNHCGKILRWPEMSHICLQGSLKDHLTQKKCKYPYQ
jgi:hypothetical protein